MYGSLARGLSWCLMLALPLLSWSCSDATSSDAVPLEVRQAAEQGLKAFPDVAGDTLGEIFAVYTIDPEAVMAGGDQAGEMIEPNGMWRAMVLASGQAVGMLTIDKVEGRWTAVAYGAAGIADELLQIRKAWPREDGYQLRKVRLYQAKADIVQVTRAGREMGFIPMTSARMAYGMAPAFNARDMQPSSVIMAASRKAVANNLR